MRSSIISSTLFAFVHPFHSHLTPSCMPFFMLLAASSTLPPSSTVCIFLLPSSLLPPPPSVFSALRLTLPFSYPTSLPPSLLPSYPTSLPYPLSIPPTLSLSPPLPSQAYEALVANARTIIGGKSPGGIGLGLSSDFIAGFCGETDAEHQVRTVLICSVLFYYVMLCYVMIVYHSNALSCSTPFSWSTLPSPITSHLHHPYPRYSPTLTLTSTLLPTPLLTLILTLLLLLLLSLPHSTGHLVSDARYRVRSSLHVRLF